jgi:Outer membrane protein beta-barrel domain
MPANEFEKQVQQQLDNFQLNPSASVWQKVEEQIREKKRRRVIFFILLPVLLGLLGFSLYEFLYTGKKPASAEQPVAISKTKKSSIPTGQTEVPVPGKVNESVTPHTAQVPTDIATTKKEERTTQQKTFQIKKAVVVNNGTEFSETNAVVGKSSSQSPVVKNNSDAAGAQKDQDNSVVSTNSAATQSNKLVATDAPVMVIDTKSAGIQQTAPGEKQEDITAVGDKNIVSPKKDSSSLAENITPQDNKEETAAKKKKSSSKIKWGIDFSAGIASNNEGTLTLGHTAGAAFDLNYYNPGSVTGVGSSGPPNPPAFIIPPSPIKAGPAFKLGLVAEWKVSKRSSFSAGLQYAYSSQRIKIGTATDTAVVFQANANLMDSRALNVDKLYSGAQQNNYTNRYHFIQLPVEYHWRINPKKKLPLQWDAGASVGYLLSTHALVYDGALGGIYYEDKKAYNKVHFNLSTGLSFRFSTKNSGEWVIGPGLSFDMTRLVKNDAKQYLMFGGINAKLFFPKKKNN